MDSVVCHDWLVETFSVAQKVRHGPNLHQFRMNKPALLGEGAQAFYLLKAKRFVVISVLFLSACVPIQPEEPHVPPPETSAALSDLASVFAKWDAHYL